MSKFSHQPDSDGRYVDAKGRTYHVFTIDSANARVATQSYAEGGTATKVMIHAWTDAPSLYEYVQSQGLQLMGTEFDADAVAFDDTTANLTPAAPTVQAAIEKLDELVDNLNTQVGIGTVDLGVFSGDVISDNTTTRGAIEELEAGIDLHTDILGTTQGDTDLGTFAGAPADPFSISDNSSVKGALQEVETYLAGSASSVDDLVTLSGMPVNSTDLGTGTGDVVADGQTIKGAIDELDDEASAARTLTGTAIGDTDLGTFAGATITDNVDIKTALGELEAAIEQEEAEENAILGVAAGATDLGTFAGNVITDNTDVVTALGETEAAIDENTDDISHLVTLSGMPVDSDDLGTFAGTTIPDGLTVKDAVQSLEVAVEANDDDISHLVTLSGMPADADDLGTFTGDIISDNVDIKTAFQELEVDLDALQALTGVLDAAADLGTFTGTLLSDNLDIKAALQEVEDILANVPVDTSAWTNILASNSNSPNAGLLTPFDDLKKALDRIDAIVDKDIITDTASFEGNGGVLDSAYPVNLGVTTDDVRQALQRLDIAALPGIVTRDTVSPVGDEGRFIFDDGQGNLTPFEVFTGAGAATDGRAGSVPGAPAGSTAKFLRATGTWSNPQDVVFGAEVIPSSGTKNPGEISMFYLFQTNAAGSGITLWLPTTMEDPDNPPAIIPIKDGVRVRIADVGGVASVENVTINPNGNNLNGGAAPVVFDQDDFDLELVFDDATNSWYVVTPSTVIAATSVIVDGSNFQDGVTDPNFEGIDAAAVDAQLAFDDIDDKLRIFKGSLGIGNTAGLVPQPATDDSDNDKFLAGDGTFKAAGMPSQPVTHAGTAKANYINLLTSGSLGVVPLALDPGTVAGDTMVIVDVAGTLSGNPVSVAVEGATRTLDVDWGVFQLYWDGTRWIMQGEGMIDVAATDSVDLTFGGGTLSADVKLDAVTGGGDNTLAITAGQGLYLSPDAGDVSDVRTLTGTTSGDTDLGTFAGVVISDNVDIKTALQELETELADPAVDTTSWTGALATNSNSPNAGLIAPFDTLDKALDRIDAIVDKDIPTDTAAFEGLGGVLDSAYPANAGDTTDDVREALQRLDQAALPSIITRDTVSPVPDEGRFVHDDGQGNLTPFEVMTGAGSATDGRVGSVPAAPAGATAKFLRATGDWSRPQDVQFGAEVVPSGGLKNPGEISQFYLFNTAAGPGIQLFLPTMMEDPDNPPALIPIVDGVRIRVADIGGSAAVENVTINGNGNSINGAGLPVVLDQNDFDFELVYDDATTSWYIVTPSTVIAASSAFVNTANFQDGVTNPNFEGVASAASDVQIALDDIDDKLRYFKGSLGIANTGGLVPRPATDNSDDSRFLAGDGTWKVVGMPTESITHAGTAKNNHINFLTSGSGGLVPLSIQNGVNAGDRMIIVDVAGTQNTNPVSVAVEGTTRTLGLDWGVWDLYWDGTKWIMSRESYIDTVDTDSVDLSFDNGTLSADVKLDAVTGAGDNVIVETAGQGLYVSPTSGDQGDIRTLTGTAVGDTDLGTFTGVTITDAGTIKAALQELETALEETDQNVDDLITLSGVAENATDLGVFTGDIITDASDIKTALQELETELDFDETGWDGILDAGNVGGPYDSLQKVLDRLDNVQQGSWTRDATAVPDIGRYVYDDGLEVGDPNKITTIIENFTGAGTATDGASGTVPAAPAGATAKFLRATGDWANPQDIQYGAELVGSGATKNGEISQFYLFDTAGGAGITLNLPTLMEDPDNPPALIPIVDGVRVALADIGTGASLENVTINGAGNNINGGGGPVVLSIDGFQFECVYDDATGSWYIVTPNTVVAATSVFLNTAAFRDGATDIGEGIDTGVADVQQALDDIDDKIRIFIGDDVTPANNKIGLVPKPNTAGGDQGKFLKSDGTWDTPPDMIGATTAVIGEAGLVPQPAIDDQNKFLTGGGTFASAVPSFSAATDYEVGDVFSAKGGVYSVSTAFAAGTHATAAAARIAGDTDKVADAFTVTAVTAAGTTAENGDQIHASSAGGAYTINLSASPIVGDSIRVLDPDGTHGANNVTLNALTGTIEGSATKVLGLNYGSYHLLYTGTQWVVLAEAAGSSVMLPATTAAAGAAGIVPQPLADEQNRFLQGDGTFGTSIPAFTAGVDREVGDIISSDGGIYRVQTAFAAGAYASIAIAKAAGAVSLVADAYKTSAAVGPVALNAGAWSSVYTDTSGGAVTLTFPAAPVTNDMIRVVDAGGAFGTNNTTVNGNGKNIEGNATAVLDMDYGVYEFIYTGTEWIVQGESAGGSVMVGATTALAGTAGSVPAPAIDQQNKVLVGDGTWKAPVPIWNPAADYEIGDMVAAPGGAYYVLNAVPGGTHATAEDAMAAGDFTRAVEGFAHNSTTGAVTASPFDSYSVDASGGAFTITLPVNPSTGDQVRVIDETGDFETNNVTIAGGAKTIEGNANYVCDVAWGAYVFHYTDAGQWTVEASSPELDLVLFRYDAPDGELAAPYQGIGTQKAVYYSGDVRYYAKTQDRVQGSQDGIAVELDNDGATVLQTYTIDQNTGAVTIT